MAYHLHEENLSAHKKKRCFMILYGSVQKHKWWSEIFWYSQVQNHFRLIWYKNYLNRSRFAKSLQKVYCCFLWTTVYVLRHKRSTLSWFKMSPNSFYPVLTWTWPNSLFSRPIQEHFQFMWRTFCVRSDIWALLVILSSKELIYLITNVTEKV